MASAALKYGVLLLSFDRPTFTPFVNHSEFMENCRSLADKQLPYVTFEKRMRDDRWLWHPCETRFFDPKRNGR